MGGNRIFALRRHQLWAVDLEQRLALAHGLAGGVDMQAFDVALELGGDGVGQALVGFDAACRAHHLVQVAQADSLNAHPELLNLVGADLDLVGASGFRFLIALVDGDVIHPHRVLLGRGGRIGQAHRIAVIENLALLLIVCRSNSRCRLH